MSKKQIPNETTDKDGNVHSIAIDGMYENWFLDYASYVILERAVPRIEDGLKPVQRRIAHAIKEMDDGRFNKVANVIGSTMQYHPHGDAAIGEAIVNIGQKDLLLDTQGNWGDVRTGDSAAAPRYIEARLSKFALDVVYNPQTTEWQLSYDGRKKEPVTLPVKFPLLLAQGVEGIAVGLSTKILPHNFCELIKASIDVLKGKNPEIYPDFPTGGIGDFSEYEQGFRGGKIKVRAKIEIEDKKTLLIKEIPFGTTTASLMESIVKASEKGKIKVKQVVDNTAKDVEISVSLQAGISPEIAIDALYAFTDCEVSISPNACVIVADKPQFMKVNEILKYNTELTVKLLKQELEIRKAELMEKILFSSLEKIFIEKRIYRNIEDVETFEEVITTVDKGLRPYKKQFYREITRDDILRLLEIRIKRISKYDSFKADELMRDLEKELKETLHHLKHLTDYAIAYYQNLLDKYGKGRERKTEIKSFTSVAATEVIANNQKLYVNREDGFIGWSLKKDEFIADCSELDDVIVIRRDGKAKVSRINEKVFMGKDILHVGIWRKGDERMIYNLVYSDGKGGITYAKRFAMPAITRDKEYNLDMGNPNSKVHYLSANPNGEAEVVEVKLTPASSARKKIFDFDFSELEVKGRGVRGNMITKYPVRKVDFKESRGSTLSGLDLWFDEASGRLNKDKRGKYVGKFDGDDQIIAITKSGAYKITSYELTNRYEPEKTILVQKYNPKKVVTAVYLDGESKQYFVKRFLIETNTLDKEFGFISEGIGSRLDYASTSDSPEIEMDVVKGKGKDKETEVVSLDEIVDVKGWKALGNRLSQYKVTKIKSLEDPDETGFEEGDSDNDVATVETSKSSQPSKKKFPYATAPGNRWEEPEEGEQASLFEESQSQANQSQPLVNGQPPKPKEKKPTVEQANLFEEDQNQKKEVKKDDDEKGYTPGQTVELDF
ncbi:MAG: DNA gyrase/topoisomerase IV subunit A [Cytophagales bacterium]|nr:DNA gyrase/topoisomerase IV subunit A [Cytophagales bacterium]MCA6369244.1 DNA gyrase/topoisomerase IV subunit A [Cytophagales bacterium]MCA6372407.1 DNA gyrase/topoisomerase IV subunit A [Cytophagales bacterium]MCA6374754.1 DNA gyrase/topoisomerase IV subunit A [Cytophagales bacterium]MCA6382202.1 DNA gyrase/topoisomerase IV subunit A [Cytophagales bacterium]